MASPSGRRIRDVERLVREYGGRASRWVKKSSQAFEADDQMNGVGFFEDFFDNEPAAVSTFWRVVNERLAATE